jgi:O-antigen ligase
VSPKLTAAALAAFFVAVQFYTSLASLSPTPPVGYVFATRPAATALVVILVLGAAVCLVRLARERRALPAPSGALLGAWIGSAGLASALGLDPASGFQVVGIMLLAGVFHVALVRYFGEPPVGRAVLGAYLATGLVAALAGLAMLALRRPALLYALNHGRAAGLFVTANQFAAFLIAYIFIALGAVLVSRGWLRRLAYAGTGVGLVALAATFSLAGWLGAAVAGIFFALGCGARRVAAGFGIALLAGILAATLRPLAGHNPADAFDRLRTWRAGIRVAELFPLTGVGPMAYWRVYPDVRPPNGDVPGTFGALHPHDAYLSLAGETGVLGLAAAGYGWVRFGRAVARGLRLRAGRGGRLCLGVCAGLLAVLTQGVFDTIGVVDMAFVWIPYTALALAAAEVDVFGEAVHP